MLDLGDMIGNLIVCAMLLIPIVLAGMVVYSLCRRQWFTMLISAILLAVMLLLLVALFAGIKRVLPRPAPEKTLSEFAGHWVGSFSPFADSKPTLPAGTVHDFILKEDGTCHVRGFLQQGSPVKVYGGDGQWRIEKNPKVAWDIVITQMLDGDQHEDRLWIVWTGRAWRLRWPWFDPDCDDPNTTNDLDFRKIKEGAK